jgi:hypothetical protein
MLPRKIIIVTAMAALCAVVVGCANDVGTPTADHSKSQQLRYYGGPKNPMWPAQ